MSLGFTFNGGAMVKARTDLDLYKLEVFHWVAEYKSFSAAAMHLSLRQPTVSAHVRTLEEQLGAKLFDRVGGKITPTPLGQLLLTSAKKVLALKKETLASLDQFHGNIRGELVVGGSNIPGEYILPPKLAAFVRKYPEVKPVLRIGDSTGIIQAVLDGAVEIGFVGFKGKSERLAFHKIWKDEMVLAVGGNHPWTRLKAVDLAELRNEGFISREGGSGTLRSFRTLLARKRYKAENVLRMMMELGSTAAIKEALITGVGFSILSRTSIQRELRDGLLKQVPLHGLNKLERDFFQVVHRQRALSPVSHVFIQFLKHG
jgi:DNA-binding transcriptional LysR family regulator